MTESVGPHTVRASDAEREEFASTVREAVGEGRLSLDEGEERLAKIYAARFREELPPLIRDLPHAGPERGGPAGGPAGGRGPGGPGAAGPGSWRGGPGPWGGYGGRGPWGHGRPGRGPWTAEDGASAGPWGRHSLFRHVTFAGVLAAVLIGIWAITASHFFWPAIPLVFITLGLLRHARWHAWSVRR